MARRSRAPARFVRPPARTMIWLGNSIDKVNVPASSAVLIGVLNAAALALRPFTIVRSRMLIAWQSDQIVASEIASGGYGEVVVKSDASTIGITAVPHPLAQINAEWHVWQGLHTKFSFASGVGFDTFAQQYQVDSRAMRKVGINEDAISVVEIAEAIGADITIRGRLLIKLH